MTVIVKLLKEQDTKWESVSQQVKPMKDPKIEPMEDPEGIVLKNLKV